MPQPSSSHRIADVLAVNLKSVFAHLCAKRYGGPVSLERVDRSSPSPSTVTFRLDREDLPPLWVRFTVRHVGGNMYDVEGTIENGPSQSFTYSLPEPAPLVVPRAPYLAHEVASFLLDAMERHLGSDLLRGKIHKSKVSERNTSPSPPSNRSIPEA